MSGQDFGYFNDVVTATVVTVEPSCRHITYTLVVIVDSGEIITRSVSGTGSTTPMTIATDPITTDDDSIICAYVFSSRGGREGTKNVLDRFPDDPNCVTVAEGGTGGGAGHA